MGVAFDLHFTQDMHTYIHIYIDVYVCMHIMSQRLDKKGRMVPSILQFQFKTNIKEGQDITLYNVCSVHQGMFSTLGVFSTSGGYHEYIGGIS